ncbi:MAG: hypothetical protein IT207_01655 [Fimbriimonadaceae bacterium]|nr:hypothetical protein [Fimbriimonadaceae bacterium]
MPGVLALAVLLSSDWSPGQTDRLELAIAEARRFAALANVLSGPLRAAMAVEGSDGAQEYVVAFERCTFHVGDEPKFVSSFINSSRLALREARKPGESRGQLPERDVALRRLEAAAELLYQGMKYVATRLELYADDPPAEIQIPRDGYRGTSSSYGYFRRTDARGTPYFTLAGSFKLLLDPLDGEWLEYSAYVPGEVTSDTDLIGEAAARRIAEAVALEHFGSGSQYSTMELGYSEPRPDTPGATFRGRGGSTKEIRLAWRFMIEKFSYQGRWVDLCIDVDSATGQVLWTNPRPRDPRKEN